MRERNFHPVQVKWRALVNKVLNLTSPRLLSWRGICRRAERLHASEDWCCFTKLLMRYHIKRYTYTHTEPLSTKKKTSPCTMKRGKYISSPSSQASPYSSRDCQAHDASRFLHRRIRIRPGGEKRFLVLEFSSFNLISPVPALPLRRQFSHIYFTMPIRLFACDYYIINFDTLNLISRNRVPHALLIQRRCYKPNRLNEWPKLISWSILENRTRYLLMYIIYLVPMTSTNYQTGQAPDVNFTSITVLYDAAKILLRSPSIQLFCSFLKAFML
jgi:hypothetical protein